MGKIKPFVGLLPEITIVKLSSNGIIVKNIIPSIDFFMWIIHVNNTL